MSKLGLWVYRKTLLNSTALLFSFLLFPLFPVKAQITPDNSLGSNASQVTPNVLINNANADRIDGGVIRDLNLFHSFREFNVNDGQRVYFANPSGVQNILTRVTGANPSNIFGTLGVDGAANLWLMNPNGILFGQNSRLDIRGSFVGTTANSVQFADGNVFAANTNSTNNNLLTVSVPVGLQMGSQIGKIENSSVNGLETGAGLMLVGGEISLNRGNLGANAPLELAGVGANGQVGINLANRGLNVPVLNFAENTPRGNISLTNGSLISGLANSPIRLFAGEINLDGGSGIIGINGGSIHIDGTSLNLNNNSSLSSITQTAARGGDIQVQVRDNVNIRTSRVSSITTATGDSGDIEIAGRNINVIGDGKNLGSGNIFNVTTNQGNTGSLTLKATDTINVSDRVYIGTSVSGSGSGNGGDLIVEAKNGINISNNATLFNSLSGTGNGGNIQISTGLLRLNNAPTAGISTLSDASGVPGSIFIKVDDTTEIINSGISTNALRGSGDSAGNITLETGKLILADGGSINADTLSSAKGGDILITAREFVAISGKSPTNNILFSVISSRTALGATGDGGNITINTPRLSVTQGGEIATSSIRGNGSSGNINIRAKDVELDGFIILDPNNLITLDGSSSISNISTQVLEGQNNNIKAGNINIATERLHLSNGGKLKSSVLLGQGVAGNIFVNAADTVDISGVGPRNRDGIPLSSGIFAELQTGAIGEGGNIELVTNQLRMSRDGQISAGSFAEGDGGNILIRANQIDMQGSLTVIYNAIAPAGKGNAGRIQIDTQGLNLRDGAFISSATFGQGNAGDLIVNADNIFLVGEATSLSSAVVEGGRGNGGNLRVSTNRLFLQDGAFISSRISGVGKAGNIFIDAKNQVRLEGNNTVISVRSDSDGTAGNININTPSLRLFNNAAVTADTTSQDGGNINITNADLVLLRQGSNISTTAGENGNGGNINIQSTAIVAPPQENSDIRANAFRGRGGNVNITTEGLFGIATATQPSKQSEITASSEVGIQGQVTVNQPDVDPAKGIIELPTLLEDKSDQIGRACPRNYAEAEKQGSFTITGRGSLAPSSLELLPGEINQTQLATLPSDAKPGDKEPGEKAGQASNHENYQTKKPAPTPIIEAQGWVKTTDGQVQLVANVPNQTLPSSINHSVCVPSKQN